MERERNKFLYEQHEATGEKLVAEGQELLGAVTESVRDVGGLQEKLDRRRAVDSANQEEISSFQQVCSRRTVCRDCSFLYYCGCPF